MLVMMMLFLMLVLEEMKKGRVIFQQKKNIQSIFPFRQNIWSKDVTQLVLSNQNLDKTFEISKGVGLLDSKSRVFEILSEKVTSNFTIEQKLKKLLEIDTKSFNHIVFEFLKTTDYTLSKEENFLLLKMMKF